jgi:primosomal protein N' (replication factor Y)
MRLASVAVPVPGLDLLTYLVPDGLETPAIGARVLVPLGTRLVTGCVVRVEEAPDDAEPPAEATRPIADVLDAEPFVVPGVVELARWVAEYYACGPGDAIAAAMPPFAWVESERVVQITEAGLKSCSATVARQQRDAAQESLQYAAQDSPRNAAQDFSPAMAPRLLDLLAHGRPVPIRVLARTLPRARAAQPPAIHSLLRSLQRDGLVQIAQALRGRRAAFRTARTAAISAEGLDVIGQPAGEGGLALGPRQQEALNVLKGVPEGLPLSTLRERGIAADTVKRLARHGLVTLRTVRVERDPFAQAGLKSCSATESAAGSATDTTAGAAAGAADSASSQSAPVGQGFSRAGDRQLTSEQSAALERLTALADHRAFAVALVHGVTGSGKTEIYLRLARHVVDAGRAVLVMVPEIALTPALAAQFRAAFGDRVAVQHSGLSGGERHDQWHRIRRGEIAVVVGTRSAVFAPLSNVGLVVVDEEHDGSYKQEETPRYNGRDVAVVRGRRDGALVVLGSATPSIETYQNALAGRYEHLVLERRVLDRPLAGVRLVNMREEYAAEGPDVVFSEPLRAAIEHRLNQREQVLVLLNRRGFATAVFCRQCGNTIDCPNCSVSLTVHGRDRRRARCHYCNYSILVPTECQSCAAPYLEQVGVGTERLEEDAARLFPGARVARLDRDVASRRGAMPALLERFGAGDIDILIGTQMIAKGHDFPRVTLVGVISADVGLGLPDFRAAERTFQLLTQVVGRAGRGELPGEAIIQTLYPEHYSVRLACRQDYPAFFAEELKFRRAMHYPPEVALVNVIVRGPSLRAAMEDAADLVRRVRAQAGGAFRVLGPAPAAFVKLRGEHRAQFFVKGKHRTAMRQAVQRAMAERPDLRRRVSIDVDPLSVL